MSIALLNWRFFGPEPGLLARPSIYHCQLILCHLLTSRCNPWYISCSLTYCCWVPIRFSHRKSEGPVFPTGGIFPCLLCVFHLCIHCGEMRFIYLFSSNSFNFCSNWKHSAIPNLSVVTAVWLLMCCPECARLQYFKHRKALRALLLLTERHRQAVAVFVTTWTKHTLHP